MHGSGVQACMGQEPAWYMLHMHTCVYDYNTLFIESLYPGPGSC